MSVHYRIRGGIKDYVGIGCLTTFSTGLRYIMSSTVPTKSFPTALEKKAGSLPHILYMVFIIIGLIKTIILPVILYGCETWYHTGGGTYAESVPK